MSQLATSPIDRAFLRAALLAGVVVSTLGAIGIAAWIFGMPAVQSFAYGFATMKMNTAISLFLAGAGLVLTTIPSAFPLGSKVTRGCGWLVALLGVGTLLEYATGLDLHIDQLLIRAPDLSGGEPPGRMAPNTALCLALIGTAMLLLEATGRTIRALAEVALLLALCIGFLALSGYLLSVNALYGVAGYTSMALPTAIALTTVAAGLLASRPDRGVVAILAQQNSTGTAVRRFLPLLVTVPLLLAWLQRLSVDAGHFGTDFSAALTATVSVCLLSALALRGARIQGKWEDVRAQSDQQVRLAMEGAPNAMLVVDARGKVVLANAEVERLFGYSRAELLGDAVEKLIPADLRREHERLRAGYQSEPVARPMAPAARTLYGTHKDGSVVPVEIGLNPMPTPRDDLVLATIVDVRNREQLERAAERERFFQLSSDALGITNPSGYFVQVNAAFERILGYTREEMLATPYLSLIHPDDVQPSVREMQKARTDDSVLDFRNRYRAKDGAYRWLQWRAIPDHSGLVYVTARDITNELEAVSALQASFKERGVLLQEVHHRVKNNLQIIASMINMQVRTISTGAARDALEECGSRVRAIGLIHEKLYLARDFGRLPFRDYAVSLVDTIVFASARDPAAVACQMDIAPVLLTVEKAIPCGLIINELVTNAFKHAFPDDRHGVIRVSLREQTDGQLALAVADDGVGLAADFDIEKSSSVGLTLVTTLVEQLKGNLSITRAPGASFAITFPQDSKS